MRFWSQLILHTLVSGLLSGSLAWAGGQPGQAIKTETRSTLNAVIESQSSLDRGGFGAILFSDRGELWARESGLEADVPLGRNTPVMVGTLSGRFVILALAKLAEEGKLKLDQPVAAYLKELPKVASRGGSLARIGQMSLATLAAEATGHVDAVPRVVSNYELHRDLLRGLEARPARYPANVKQTRSDGCIDLLALVMERVSKQPWAHVVGSRVFGPLGMKSSAFAAPARAAHDNVFFYEDGTVSDPGMAESLLPPLTPSESMQSSLADLAACGSALLAAYSGNPAAGIASASAERILTPRIAGQLDRQGFESGLGWNLTESRLGYLGHVAWAAGSELTHRSLVLLLPDQHVGIVLVSRVYDPEGPFQLKHLAIDLIQDYFQQERGLEPPAFRIPSTYPSIPESVRPPEGLYASEAGVVLLSFDGELLTVSTRGSFGQFAWERGGRFVPTEENEFAGVEAGERGQVTLLWRSGRRMKVAFQPVLPLGLELEPGPCRLERQSPSGGRLDTFLIDRLEGHWIITADDGQSYLLVRDGKGAVRALCDEASMVYGFTVAVDSSGRVHVAAP